jgi:hypothetical protein
LLAKDQRVGIMINNDRILANAAGAPLLMEVPATLRD